jgi:ElaB/YqjD/DUF883 family membrane-anchored ribosome-binding protein
MKTMRTNSNVEHAAGNANLAIDRVAALAHQAVDKAAGAAAPTADWLTERGDQLDARRKRLVSDSSDLVASHPLKAVGIALVAGFVLSRFFR